MSADDHPGAVAPNTDRERRLATTILETYEDSIQQDLRAKGPRPYRDVRWAGTGALAWVVAAIIAGAGGYGGHPEIPLVWGIALPTIVGLWLLLRFNKEQRKQVLRDTRKRFAREREAYVDETMPWPKDPALALRRAENLAEHADLHHRLLTQRLLRDASMFALIAIPVGTVATYATLEPRAQVFTIVSGLIFEGLAAAGLSVARARSRELESDLRQLDYERSLLTEDATQEARAEKLFLKQQFEMKRYYDETLRQSAMLSYLGLLCIVGGFAVIGVAVYVIVNPVRIQGDLDTQRIVVAALGIAGAVLANVVAALFLRMHSGTVAALSSFHERHVSTHHVHFGNLVASKIGDKGRRNEVLADVAGSLSRAACEAPRDRPTAERAA